MRSRLRSALVVLALAIGATVCAAAPTGSTADGSPTTAGPITGIGTKASAHDLSAFAACMRANGVADFPDPSPDGEIRLPGDIDRSGATFQAASAACHGELPAAGGDQPGTAGSSSNAPSVGNRWQQVTPGGGCACADGSAFSFQVRAASPDNVLVYFQAGGACFTAALCEPDSGTYHPSVGQAPPEAHGIFDFTNARNPFADYTIVYVPYCTGDTFLGDATVDYTADLKIDHAGFADGSAALDYISAHYPDANNVVIAGESAGSVAAPLYGGLAAERYPNAAVTVIADSSGFYPDQPEINHRLAQAWNVGPAITALTAGTAGADDFSIPGLFVLSGHSHPGVVFARFDYAADAQQARWKDLAGVDLVAPAINEAAIEQAGVNIASYTAPGDDHVILSNDRFYSETVHGERLVDWVDDLINHRPVVDVASS